MAILIQEQEKGKDNNKKIIMAFSIIGGLIALGWFVYYVFFSATPLVESVGNSNVKVQNISAVKIDVGSLNSLISAPEWQQLKSGLVSPISSPASGTSSLNSNPFESK